MTDIVIEVVDSAGSTIEIDTTSFNVVEVAQVNTNVTVDVTETSSVIEISETSTVIDVIDPGEAAETFLTNNVLDFGATGDGTTDDSVAIQAALDASLGYELYFPAGTYLCAGLVLPHTVSSSTITLRGAGKYVTTLKLKSGANTYIIAAWSYVNNTTTSNRGAIFKDIGFDGDKGNQSTFAAAVIARGFQGEFSNISIINSKGHGLLFTAVSANGTAITNGMGDNRVSSCSFKSNDGSGLYGDDQNSQLADLMVYDSVLSANGLSSNGYYNLDIERGAGLHVVNNKLYGSPNGDIRALACGGTIISGNNIDGTLNVATATQIKTVRITTGGFGTVAIVGNMFRNSATALGGTATEARLLDLNESIATGITVTGNTFHAPSLAITSIIYAKASTISTRLKLAGNVFAPNCPAPNGPLYDYENIYVQGLKGDATDVVKTVSIAASSKTLTITGSNPFIAADIGKVIIVPGAGTNGVWKGACDGGLAATVTAADLVTTITAVGSTTITLNDAAATTVSSVSLQLFYASDDYAALNTAMSGNKGLFALDPSKRYFFYSGAPYIGRDSRLTSLCKATSYTSGTDDFRFRETLPALILNPAYPIILETAAAIDGFTILRMGLRTPGTTARNQRRFVERYTGTCIQVGAASGTTYQTTVREPTIAELVVVGFNKTLDFLATNTARPLIDHVMSDGINGIDLKNCGDVSRIMRCHFWPFGTANALSGNPTTFAVTAASNDGSGGIRITIGSQPTGPIDADIVFIRGTAGADAANLNWRWKLVAVDQANGIYDLANWDATSILAKVPVFGTFDLTAAVLVLSTGWRSGIGINFVNSDGGFVEATFAKGYDIGYSIFASNKRFTDLAYESHELGDPATIGCRFTADVETDEDAVITGGKLVNCSLLSAGLPIHYNCASGNLSKLLVIGGTIGYGIYRTLQLLDGKVEFIGIDWKRAAYSNGNNFYVASAATLLSFVGEKPRNYALTTEAAADAAKVRFTYGNDRITYKLADTARSSTTTAADDPELQIWVPANSVCEVRSYLRWTQGGSATGSLKYGVTVTPSTGCNLDWFDPSNVGAEKNITGTISDTHTGDRAVTVLGALRVGNSDVLLTLQWAQNSSSTTATTVREGSYLICKDIN